MAGASAGERIGPYELISPVGAGGMGEAWKARDTRLDRVVAIKFSQAQFSDRFEREARAGATLNHPNIARIYDVGDEAKVFAALKPGGIVVVEGLEDWFGENGLLKRFPELRVLRFDQTRDTSDFHARRRAAIAGEKK